MCDRKCVRERAEGGAGGRESERERASEGERERARVFRVCARMHVWLCARVCVQTSGEMESEREREREKGEEGGGERERERERERDLRRDGGQKRVCGSLHLQKKDREKKMSQVRHAMSLMKNKIERVIV